MSPVVTVPDVGSILDTIKFMLGIQSTDFTFDTAIILDINSVLMILNQLGVTDTVFVVTGNGEQWTDLLTSGDDLYLSLVKSYIYLKVQAIFDPPTSGIVSTATNNLIDEFEKRLVLQVETRPAV